MTDKEMFKQYSSQKEKIPTITVPKDSEFFMALAEKKDHTFIIIGVVLPNGKPRALLKVGKVYDANKRIHPFKLFFKGTIEGRLTSHSLFQNKRESENQAIYYQAHSIDYQQVKDFLSVVTYLESEQDKNSKINRKRLKVYKNKHPASDSEREYPSDEEILSKTAMKGYVPVQEDDSVSFTHRQLQKQPEFNSKNLFENLLANDKKRIETLKNITISSQKMHILLNNCRTTAHKIVTFILGFAPKVSQFAWIRPTYKTNFRDGQADKPFYILPKPPAVDCQGFSKRQRRWLEKLYARMEKIPTLNPDANETWEKFNKLKSIYIQLRVGKLTDVQILSILKKHTSTQEDRAILFKNRKEGLFAMPSKTEVMFQEVLRKEDIKGL